MYLLFDIGGTNTRVAISKNKNTIEDIRIFPTNQDFEEAINNIQKVVKDITGGERVEAAALGFAGVINKDKTGPERSRHISGWNNKPLKNSLFGFIDAPVFIENDAMFNALGEASFGAGKGFEIVAFFTLSTGFGGARVVRRMIDQNSLGFEPGKQIVELHGDSPVILEDKLSGGAFEKIYGEKPEKIKDPSVWDEAAKLAAVGVNNALVFWSPDCVVLGGSLMESLDLELIKSRVRDYVKVFPNIPPIKKAELGDKSGLYGALAYLNAKAY